MIVKTAQHYDLLIEENNDPVHDSPALKAYMEQWDGPVFLNALKLSGDKSVLEIGMGTGRLAIKTAPLCKSYTGIDISPKTIEKARLNLSALTDRISLICDDFVSHSFLQKYDVIYSSLTFMHIKEKQKAIDTISKLLNHGGIFALSLDKNRNRFIDFGNRKVKVYPDSPEKTIRYITRAGLTVQNLSETKFAYIITAVK